MGKNRRNISDISAIRMYRSYHEFSAPLRYKVQKDMFSEWLESTTEIFVKFLEVVK